jgi:hypothetical protein
VAGEYGVSEPVFFKSSFAVNKELYTQYTSNKCLLLLHKFIQKHPNKKKKLFWPDLASANYTKDTLARLQELKIENVPKEENSTNIPQLRQIENFWANLKRKVYSNNYRPKDIKCLMAKIRKEVKSIETTGLCKA